MTSHFFNSSATQNSRENTLDKLYFHVGPVWLSNWFTLLRFNLTRTRKAHSCNCTRTCLKRSYCSTLETSIRRRLRSCTNRTTSATTWLRSGAVQAETRRPLKFSLLLLSTEFIVRLVWFLEQEYLQITSSEFKWVQVQFLSCFMNERSLFRYIFSCD